jgi:hypothetical protein
VDFKGIQLLLQTIDLPIIAEDGIVDQPDLRIDIVDDVRTFGQFALDEGELAETRFLVLSDTVLDGPQLFDLLLDLFPLAFQFFPRLPYRSRCQENSRGDQQKYGFSPGTKEIAFYHIHRI